MAHPEQSSGPGPGLSGAEDGNGSAAEGAATSDPDSQPPPKRPRRAMGASGGDAELTDDGDADSGPGPGGEEVQLSRKPPLHRGGAGKDADMNPAASSGGQPKPKQKGHGAIELVRSSASLRNSALRSVLKVFVMKCDPNYAQPWQMRPQRSSSGSAFIINRDSRRILTNSHVVRPEALLPAPNRERQEASPLSFT